MNHFMTAKLSERLENMLFDMEHMGAGELTVNAQTICEAAELARHRPEGRAMKTILCKRICHEL